MFSRAAASRFLLAPARAPLRRTLTQNCEPKRSEVTPEKRKVAFWARSTTGAFRVANWELLIDPTGSLGQGVIYIGTPIIMAIIAYGYYQYEYSDWREQAAVKEKAKRGGRSDEDAFR